MVLTHAGLHRRPPFYQAPMRFGGGLSGAQMRRFGQSGGAFVPPAAVGMRVGGNLGSNNSSSGALPFKNIAKTMRPWVQVVGTGSFTQHCGELTATVGTDEFESYLSDNGAGLPSGVYTIYNPTGAQIRVTDGVNAGNGGVAPAYSTATTFTFQYTAGNFFIIRLKGSLAKHASSEFGVLLPTYALPDANPWHPSFLTFLNGLKLKNLRFMDWCATNTSLEEDWADRTPVNAISYVNPLAGFKPPYEVMCDLTLRLDNSPQPWFCVPTRATSAYATSMAGNLQTLLGSRKPWIEYTNEAWNYNHPFADNTRWVEFGSFTRRTLTCVGGGATTYTLNAHNIAHGATARCFRTKQNAAKGITVDGSLQNGAQVYVEVVDPNTVRFHTGSVAGPVVPVAAGQVNVTIILDGEAGKTADLNARFAEMTLAHWDSFDAVMGTAGYERVCAAQAANSGTTAGRFAVAGMSTRATKVAIAPYMYGSWFHAAVDCGNTILTPKFWGDANFTVYVGHYANGSTPLDQDVIDGTGAGFIAKQTINFVAAGQNTYTSGTNLAGVNGTNYLVAMVVDDGTYRYRLNVTTSPNASASTVNVSDSFTNQARRNRLAVADSVAWVEATKLAAPGKTIVCYEGGSHFDDSAPAAAWAWLDTYLESSEYAGTQGALGYYLRSMAAAGIDTFDYFVTDALTASSSWKIADNYSDTADLRYQLIAGLNGNVTVGTLMSLANRSGTNITSDPASFPQTVDTFPNAALTYTLLGGDSSGNFAIVGNQLRITGDVGINWGVNTQRNLIVVGTDGNTEDTFTVSFSTGPAAYYGASDLYAWNSVADASATQINPDRGTALSITTGAGASIAGGMYDNGGTTAYGDSNALTAAVNTATGDFLYAAALSKGALASNFAQNGFRVGVQPFIRPYMTGGGFLRFNINNGVDDFEVTIDVLDATTRIYWLWFKRSDGKWRFGTNQTLKNPGGSAGDTPPFAFPASFGRYMDVTEQARKFGSIRVLNEDLSEAQVLAVAQSLQTVHSI